MAGAAARRRAHVRRALPRRPQRQAAGLQVGLGRRAVRDRVVADRISGVRLLRRQLRLLRQDLRHARWPRLPAGLDVDHQRRAPARNGAQLRTGAQPRTRRRRARRRTRAPTGRPRRPQTQENHLASPPRQVLAGERPAHGGPLVYRGTKRGLAATRVPYSGRPLTRAGQEPGTRLRATLTQVAPPASGAMSSTLEEPGIIKPSPANLEYPAIAAGGSRRTRRQPTVPSPAAGVTRGGSAPSPS